jgi:hypothetical protein
VLHEGFPDLHGGGGEPSRIHLERFQDGLEMDSRQLQHAALGIEEQRAPAVAAAAHGLAGMGQERHRTLVVAVDENLLCFTNNELIRVEFRVPVPSRRVAGLADEGPMLERHALALP